MPGNTADVRVLAGTPIAHLTTIGRRTKRPRTVEVWFAYQDGHVYLLGHPDAHWVKNLTENPRVTLEVDEVAFEGSAQIVDSRRKAVEKLFQNKYGAEQIAYWYGGERAPRRTIEIVLSLTAH